MRVSQYDIVHIHNLFLFPQFAAARAARRAGVPYIVSLHGALDPYLRTRGRRRKAVNDALWQRRMLEGARAIHLLTDTECQQTADIAPCVPRAVVPSGIVVDRFAGLADGSLFRRRHLDGESGPLVLYLGRISHKKGLGTLLDAFAEVRRTIPSAALAIVGPDDEGLTPGLKQRARRLGLTQGVTFTGPLYDKELQSALAACDAWVLPSHTENFGIAVIEALAAGCPVICSPGVGVAGAMANAEAGLIVQRDPSSVAAAIRRVLTEEGLADSLRARGREHARLYDWRSIGTRFADLYEGCGRVLTSAGGRGTVRGLRPTAVGSTDPAHGLEAMAPRIALSNPGKLPDVHQVACAAAAHEQLQTYFVTFDPDNHPRLKSLGALPGSLGAYASRELNGRGLGPLTKSSVECTPTADLAVAVAIRLLSGTNASSRVIWARNRRLDRFVSQRLPADSTVFIGQAGAAGRSLERAKSLGMLSAVNWNIQHWEFARAEVEQEALCNPAWTQDRVFTHSNFPDRLVRSWLEELDTADYILTPSTSVTQSFISRGYSPDRFWTIPYGVDSTRFPALERKRSRRDPLRVLCVGQVSQRKGLSYFFDVARRLPHVEFDWVGWRVAKLPEEPPNNVSLHFSAPDLLPFLQAADVFLFPSLIDGFGLVVLEAMATGLPAICSSNAGAMDVIDEGDDGWIVAPRDVERMTALLERIADDRQGLTRISANARAKAESYTWARFHRETVEAVNAASTSANAHDQR